MAGKGSSRRRDRDGEAYKRFNDNYDRIFGKKTEEVVEELEEDKDDVLKSALMKFRSKFKKFKGEKNE